MEVRQSWAILTGKGEISIYDEPGKVWRKKKGTENTKSLAPVSGVSGWHSTRVPDGGKKRKIGRSRVSEKADHGAVVEKQRCGALLRRPSRWEGRKRGKSIKDRKEALPQGPVDGLGKKTRRGAGPR